MFDSYDLKFLQNINALLGGINSSQEITITQVQAQIVTEINARIDEIKKQNEEKATILPAPCDGCTDAIKNKLKCGSVVYYCERDGGCVHI